MSAFYDIWIGSKEPHPTDRRIENSDWAVQGDANEVKHYLSLPANGHTDFVREVCLNEYKLIVIGQFYEVVNMDILIKNSISYTVNATGVFDDPAGHYIIFLLDNNLKKIHVFTNRFGTYHAYWMNDGSQKVLSTYFLGMARQSASKKLDWEGLTGFFAMGYFPNTKTYLENIKVLAPASYYQFSSSLNIITSKRYWNWDISIEKFSAQDHLAKINEAIHKSLTNSLNGYRIALPISGGLDSRMLAGIITDNGNTNDEVWGYSYGYTRRSAENEIASKIAIARNIKFDAHIVPNYLFEKLDTIKDAVELFQYVDGTRQACMKEDIEANADVVVGGHWGDVWMDSMNLNSGALYDFFEKKILKRGRHWLLSEISERFLPGTANYLSEYFHSSIKRYEHIENPDLKFKTFKTDEWSFRWTLASIRMYQAAAFPVLPFYDKYVADLLLRVPETMLAGRKMQIDFIKTFQPDLARIKWQEYDRDLYSYHRFNNRNIAYRAARKLRTIVRGTKPVTRNWEVFYLNPEGRNNLENLLLNNSVLTEFISNEKVKTLLNDFYNNPSAANGYTISMLLTFSEAVKTIF